ncbi:hypothetical protein FOCC_FOCC004388 [Frankliniella occidentalis]|nr:hypothetical protein FOCC_FOCC004388 [Frankliniella occidentalis]
MMMQLQNILSAIYMQTFQAIRVPQSEEDKDNDFQGFQKKALHLTFVPFTPLAASEIGTKNMFVQALNYLNISIKPPIPVDVISEHSLPDPTLAKQRDELSIQQKCIVMGNRVIVPQPLRSQALAILHMGHPGIVIT